MEWPTHLPNMNFIEKLFEQRAPFIWAVSNFLSIIKGHFYLRSKQFSAKNEPELHLIFEENLNLTSGH